MLFRESVQHIYSPQDREMRDWLFCKSGYLRFLPELEDVSQHNNSLNDRSLGDTLLFARYKFEIDRQRHCGRKGIAKENGLF